ncbi:MAG: GIY-YIG nuclease family protein [Elainellaceae cyanobacterium]
MTSFPHLNELDFIPYLNDDGQIPEQFEHRVGVYAIFDQTKTLQYIGYSRDVALSLKQHLVRQPQQCYWVKMQTIDRPSRTILEEIQNAWVQENGVTPSGNADNTAQWNQAIDAKTNMTDEDKATYNASDDAGKIKILKQVARRVEAEVLAKLEARGVKIPIRFDPKAKEEGLLNVK